MERDDDVERLFSWIKTPDLHYREFADREVADTAATWPAPRDAVPEPGFSDDRHQPAAPSDPDLLPPERARYVDRPAAIYGQQEPPPPDHPAETLAPREETAAVEVAREEEEAAREVPWEAEPPEAPPIFTHREAPPPTPPPHPVFIEHEPAPQPTRERPADQQYSGFEEHQEAPPAAGPARADKTRSLGAVLSRIAHSAQTSRDERPEPPRRPAGRSIFRRLR